MDNFDHSTAARQHNKYVVQGGTWFLTEFAAAYDPCTCVFQSGIEISPRLFNQQTINLDLQGTSISEPIIANSVVQSQSFSKFTSAANGVSAALGKGFKNYNSLDDFEKKLGDYVATIIAAPNTKEAPFQLPGFLKSIDKIGAIASLLEFFIGGGKTTSSPKPPSYLNKFKFEATGFIGQSTPYEIRNSYIPGSVKNVQPPVPGIVPGRIPIYNNPLGLFNLLETPKLDITLHPAWFMSFKIKEPIKYAVNPTAGLGALIQLKGALYFRPCLNGTLAEGLDYNMIAINDTMMRSPFVPLNVLPEYIMHSNWTNGIGCAPSNTLEVIATFKPPNGEEILYAARYKTQQTTPTFNNTVPTNPYAGVPENITVENQNLSGDKTFKAWNTITVNTQNIVFNGHLIYLYTAGTVIFKGPNIPQWIQQRLNAAGEFIFDGAGWPPLDPRGDYVPVKWIPGTPNPPQTPGEIAAFCTNPLKYKPQISLSAPDEEAYARQIAEQMLHNEFKVVPSIATDYTNVQFDIRQAAEVRMTVLNSIGQIEWEALNERVEAGTYVKPIDVGQLPKGMYFILVQLDGKPWNTLRFVKQ